MHTILMTAAGRLHGIKKKVRSRKGMELVQVGILIAIAVGIGIIFKDNVTTFVNNTFKSLLGTSFK